MTQHRFVSLAETMTNVCVGMAVNFTLAQTLFPAFGVPVTLHANAYVTGILTIAAIVRGYAIRRAFARRSPYLRQGDFFAKIALVAFRAAKKANKIGHLAGSKKNQKNRKKPLHTDRIYTMIFFVSGN